MRSVVLLVAVVGGVFAAFPSPAGAQVGYLWSYEELLQKADVVLIAECQGTSDTGRHRPHPELKPALPVLELQTVFRVSAVVKGVQAVAIGADVRVRHYRWDDEVPRGGIVNGGSWLRLQAQRNYLLFLLKATDGVYEPLSGHAFPAKSVLLLDPDSADAGLQEGTWCCPTTR